MFGSKNDFFFQSEFVLKQKRFHLEYLIREIWNKREETVQAYLEAYDFFCSNPEKYDGATIVNDLNLIPGLDIWAMLHDYIYIKFNVAVNLIYKNISDIFYAEEMRKYHVAWGTAWLIRYGGLFISNVYFPLREIFKGKKFTSQNKKELLTYLSKFN